MNLVEISYGWVNYLTGGREAQERMIKRLKICDKCPNKEQVDKVTGAVLKITGNQKHNLYRCALCKCPLGALAASPNDNCKDKRW